MGAEQRFVVIFLLASLLQIADCRPFFNSHFYMDNHHLKGHRHTHFGRKTPQNSVDRPIELRFVSFDDGGKPVENKIEFQPESNHPLSQRHGDFFVSHLWNDGVRDENEHRTNFVVRRARKQRNRMKTRKRVSHGLLGLWG